MNDYKVIFEDGNELVTGFNGTLEDAADCYLGNYFQFGDTEECPKDKLIKAIIVREVTC
jgi:hypothetical protein